MAACPWCTTRYQEGYIGGTTKCFCTSKQNPGVKKKGDISNTGVCWARCVEGKVYQGVDFKHCPFFKKKTTRKR